MSIVRPPSARFRVGDWVTLLFGPRRMIAQVVEDRGRIGVHRRRLYRIRPLGQDETMAFELSEEQLAPAPLPDKPALVDYLRRGGLVAILRSNLTGGRDQPKVLFLLSPQGEVVHTFDIGGAAVPFFSLYGDRIFTPQKNNVTAFLTNFGLSREDAERVVDSIGTAP